MASRGISLVYKLGGEELQGALLRQLVGVLGGEKGAAPTGGAKVTGRWWVASLIYREMAA
jgi:hypothetical protein